MGLRADSQQKTKLRNKLRNLAGDWRTACCEWHPAFKDSNRSAGLVIAIERRAQALVHPKDTCQVEACPARPTIELR